MGPSNLLAVVDSLRGRIDLWSTTNWKQAEVFKFVQVEGVWFNECLSASSNGSLLAFPVGNDAHQTGSIDAGLIIERPFAVETKALQASPECVAAREKVEQSSARLAELRKKLSAGKVEAHPKVSAASKAVKEIETVIRADEKAVAVERSSASKAQRAVASAQAALSKARQAEAKDSNKNSKNNKGKKK